MINSGSDARARRPPTRVSSHSASDRWTRRCVHSGACRAALPRTRAAELRSLVLVSPAATTSRARGRDGAVACGDATTAAVRGAAGLARTRPRCSRADTLTTKKCPSKVAKQGGGGGGCVFFFFFLLDKIYLPAKSDTAKGGTRRSSTPLSPPVSLPRAALRGSRRKCHRFQQWLPPPPTDQPNPAVRPPTAADRYRPEWRGCPRLTRPCCPERRLLLSSGRFGIEPPSQHCSG